LWQLLSYKPDSKNTETNEKTVKQSIRPANYSDHLLHWERSRRDQFTDHQQYDPNRLL